MRISKNISGFNLTELMVSLLILSALGMGMTSYIKKSQVGLQESQETDDARISAQIIQQRLNDDLSQVVYLRPSCDDKPPAGTGVTADCDSVKVLGGVTPLPGVTKTSVENMTSTRPPNNLNYETSSLTNANDSMRLLLYNFSGSEFNCHLSATPTTNPSQTAGTGSGAERLWLDYDQCNGKVAVGGLYIITQTLGTSDEVFANLFQITAIEEESSPEQRLQVDVSSINNRYNQEGGLGLSGYSGITARIYPVKLVEWTIGDNEGVYRREITPSANDMTGYQDWALLQADVEGMQLFPLTMTADGSIEHQRTITWSDPADTDDDGIEDIRGVSPRVVTKSNRQSPSGRTYDNPLTAANEADHYPRKEIKFFVSMKNTN